MSAGFKARSASDFYGCQNAACLRQPWYLRLLFDRWPFSLEEFYKPNMKAGDLVERHVHTKVYKPQNSDDM